MKHILRNTGLLLMLAATAAAVPASNPAGGAKRPITPPGKFLAPGYYIPRPFNADSVTIECSDGYKLAGDLIRRAKIRQPLPGVVFIHEAGRDKRSWYPLTIQVAGRGFAVLSIDLRGHGENPGLTGNPKTKAADLKPADYEKMAEDVRNAVGYLANQAGVNPDNIALIGAGLGANVALVAAAQPWAKKVKCVIALSPLLEDHGYSAEKAVPELGKRHAYFAAAKGDAESFPAAVKLLELAKGPKEMLSAEGAARGVALFGAGLLTKMPAWLFNALIKGAPDLPPAEKPASSERK